MKEHQQVEWKETWRDEWLKWICGFANAEGGMLVIGRDDQGKPVGVANAKKLLDDLPNKIRDVLGIMVDVRLAKKSGKELIEIHVNSYPTPISYKGEYFYRTGSTTQELKGPALERFLMRKRGRHWDDAPEPSFTVRSCSPAAIKLFKQRAMDSGRMDRAVLRDRREILMGNLELTDKCGLRRAACLLFSDHPEKYVSGAWIKVGFFVTNYDLRYQDEVHGSLFHQVDETLDLLHTKYLKAWGRGIEKVEHECRIHGVDPPSYEIDPNGMMVTFHANPAHIKAAGKSFPAVTTTQETTQERILLLLRTMPTITRRELAERIGITSDGIKYHLRRLAESGIIRHVGPTKAGRWEVPE